MKITAKNLLLVLVASCSILHSCSTELDYQNEDINVKEAFKLSTQNKTLFDNAKNPAPISWEKQTIGVNNFDLSANLLNSVEPSECAPTSRWEAMLKNDELLTNSFLSIWDGNVYDYYMVFENYFLINRFAAIEENKNADYFGEDGEYTSLVNKRIKNLEKFWNMPNRVEVRGQHTKTLEDLDFIRLIYQKYSDASPETIDYLVDISKKYNEASDQIPENPYYALDGFGTADGYIVIGDEAVNTLVELGLDAEIAYTSILAHEWAHQIEYMNSEIFDYPFPPFSESPESIRMIELEADFYAGYYMTHKRGGTYNWKRVEKFLQIFFESGDCLFESLEHHGTPIQRMEAARQGYLFANSLKKKGKIGSVLEVHEAYMDKYELIIGN